ncbi:lmo0937 family membrane protein [Mesobacillus subterraneus]|uniref:Lmo0937 family membrane protein n=1 Tax=Mesobacillus subterraneus TaxID=285983 RepID=A0A427TK63_9BACI|nr:lmo0937 family membrane protein [Mesobacillus subterraneus]RSD24420.1 lmo0937 family membrane protein [Mesobacillus subterraneus]
MLWTIAAILLVLWVLGLVFEIAGGIIHILLVIGIILIAYNAIKGRATGPK